MKFRYKVEKGDDGRWFVTQRGMVMSRHESESEASSAAQRYVSEDEWDLRSADRLSYDAAKMFPCFVS